MKQLSESGDKSVGEPGPLWYNGAMRERKCSSMDIVPGVNRHEFMASMGVCTAAAGGLVLGVPSFEQTQTPPPPKIETNIGDFMEVPKTEHSLPGPFPGKVIKVSDPRSLQGDKFDSKIIADMVQKGIGRLTGRNAKESFKLFFEKKDVVGIKVNPVGPPLINTRPEVVEALIQWLVKNGIQPWRPPVFI